MCIKQLVLITRQTVNELLGILCNAKRIKLVNKAVENTEQHTIIVHVLHTHSIQHRCIVWNVKCKNV